jgi:cyclic pyranopterin phosphate synthase
MKDSFGRIIDYMRVSVTDRCNLRCQYCMPQALPWVPHADILRYEEFLLVCRAAASLGLRAVRVTGGEPLVRKGCVDFLARLKEVPGIERVTLTTNGLLLAPCLPELARMRLDGVNISLNTLRQETYRRLSGVDGLETVLAALKEALAAGLRVKINCVPMLGVNDGEITALAGLAAQAPVDVRFIELMPIGGGRAFTGLPGEAVLARLSAQYPDLSPAAATESGESGESRENRGFGPARYYAAQGLLGRIGLITALSQHFCGECNRVRLTSQGFLQLCLYHQEGVDLRRLLRQGAGWQDLAVAIREGIGRKPESHRFGWEKENQGIKSMSRIGG